MQPETLETHPALGTISVVISRQKESHTSKRWRESCASFYLLRKAKKEVGGITVIRPIWREVISRDRALCTLFLQLFWNTESTEWTHTQNGMEWCQWIPSSFWWLDLPPLPHNPHQIDGKAENQLCTAEFHDRRRSRNANELSRELENYPIWGFTRCLNRRHFLLECTVDVYCISNRVLQTYKQKLVSAKKGSVWGLGWVA